MVLLGQTTGKMMEGKTLVVIERAADDLEAAQLTVARDVLTIGPLVMDSKRSLREMRNKSGLVIESVALVGTGGGASGKAIDEKKSVTDGIGVIDRQGKKAEYLAGTRSLGQGVVLRQSARLSHSRLMAGVLITLGVDGEVRGETIGTTGHETAAAVMDGRGIAATNRLMEIRSVLGDRIEWNRKGTERDGPTLT